MNTAQYNLSCNQHSAASVVLPAIANMMIIRILRLF